MVIIGVLKSITNQKLRVNPNPIIAGELVEVVYNGLLAQSNAKELYLHAGVGLDNWKNITEIKMDYQEGKGWVANFEINNGARLNLCFKDGADNWDNNQSENWSYDIKVNS